MTFKEMIRAAISGEMEDISACETDVETFENVPGWERTSELYNKLAAEKRERLLELGKIFREGTGFRQRRIEPARSWEASLRARAVRAERAAANYAGLIKAMNKPEYKEAMKALAERERAILAEIKELQAAKK